ncbi:MAG: amidohydrolase [Actinomycetia bacterium]|nr:amidohydrolase [Actinomycetes bacterium]
MIDAHNHLGRWLSDDGGWLVHDVERFLAMLNSAGVDTIVNLDGRWGEELAANIARYDAQHPGRVLTFCHVDWSVLSADFDARSAVDALTTQLVASALAGARGVKVWKDLGLQVRDSSGALVMPDDPRVVAVLQAAGDLGLPVLIHTADPVAFFEPLTQANERWDELQVHPEWWFGGPGLPTFSELMRSLDRLIAQCPGTTFIGAHVGCWAEDLDGVGQMLASHPQWNVDIAGRLGELGRRPHTFAQLVAAFPDRILFGTDCFPPHADDYARHRRFLETDDRGFAYSGDPTPPQGNWTIDGAAIEPRHLPGLYSENARRILRLTD